MKFIYHEGICPYELDDIIKLKTDKVGEYLVHEIRFVQYVRKNMSEFELMVKNTKTNLFKFIKLDEAGEIIKSWREMDF